MNFFVQNGENCDFALFPIQDSRARAKLRFEVLFKKFHPRIKPFSRHGNRSLGSKHKKLEFQNSKNARLDSWRKRLRDSKFQLSRGLKLQT
jgi:hypothetical protein